MDNSPQTKRRYRRRRQLKKAALRELDRIAQERIDKSFRVSAETWGGTRCSGCGVAVRAHHLSGPFAAYIGACRVSLCPTACGYINCPGERDDWEDNAVRRLKKRGKI